MTVTPGDLSAEAIAGSLPTRYVGRRLLYVPSVSSTMDVAYREAQAGAPEGTVVVADHQTRGRGRFQRTWVSPAGAALYVSVIFRPAMDHLLKMGIVSSLAVVRAVRRATGLQPTIKWPNDVEVRGRKLAGILIDNVMKDGGVDYVVVGIGLNVNLDPAQHPEIASIATSLARELGRPVERLPVLRMLLEELEVLYDRVRQGEAPVEEWRQVLSTLGRWVRVTWPGDPKEKSLVEEGVAEGVDRDGALLLRRSDGSLIKLFAGEVSLAPGR